MSFAYIFKSIHGTEKPIPENVALVKIYEWWKFQENWINHVGVMALSLSILHSKLTIFVFLKVIPWKW